MADPEWLLHKKAHQHRHFLKTGQIVSESIPHDPGGTTSTYYTAYNVCSIRYAGTKTEEYIFIKAPKVNIWGSKMHRLRVYGYEYSSSIAAFDLEIWGYNYSGGYLANDGWINRGMFPIDQVSIYRNDNLNNSMVIVISRGASSHSYPELHVDVLAWGNGTSEDLRGWSIELSDSLTGLTLGDHYAGQDWKYHGSDGTVVATLNPTRADFSSTFLQLPVKATTGDPSSPADGDTYVNTADNKIRTYADGAWRDLATW